MISIKILRNLAIPGSCGIIVYAKEVKGKGQGEKEKEECDESRKLVKPSELPMYTTPPKPVLCRNEAPQSFLYETISCARQELTAVLQAGHTVRSELEDKLYEVLKEGQDAIGFLREEENLVPRVGAIALGGLTGYISGLRKGFIKRLFRTGVGAGLMAAICYPREAREYSDEAIRETKKYLIIAYHFINGVSKDLTGYQLPALPTGHFFVSDKPHSPPDAVPSSAHVLPPTATPTHIPLPHEDQKSHGTKQ